MSLTHLFGHVTRKSPGGYIAALRNEGFEPINKAGNSFATCMSKADADDVVVVNLDANWAPLFYQYCRANPNNPFLPTVYEMTMHDEFCVARMEKLVAVDHVTLDAQDENLLEKNMKHWVAFMRAEEGAIRDQIKNGYSLRETARDILQLTQTLYHQTNGFILPYCDVKPDNIFLRHGQDGPEFVLGDPVFPGSGNEPDNYAFMKDVYLSFDLPLLAKDRHHKLSMTVL